MYCVLWTFTEGYKAKQVLQKCLWDLDFWGFSSLGQLSKRIRYKVKIYTCCLINVYMEYFDYMISHCPLQYMYVLFCAFSSRMLSFSKQFVISAIFFSLYNDYSVVELVDNKINDFFNDFFYSMHWELKDKLCIKYYSLYKLMASFSSSFLPVSPCLPLAEFFNCFPWVGGLPDLYKKSNVLIYRTGLKGREIPPVM